MSWQIVMIKVKTSAKAKCRTAASPGSTGSTVHCPMIPISHIPRFSLRRNEVIDSNKILLAQELKARLIFGHMPSPLLGEIGQTAMICHGSEAFFIFFTPAWHSFMDPKRTIASVDHATFDWCWATSIFSHASPQKWKYRKPDPPWLSLASYTWVSATMRHRFETFGMRYRNSIITFPNVMAISGYNMV